MQYFSSSQSKKRAPVPSYYGTNKEAKKSAFYDENRFDSSCGKNYCGEQTILKSEFIDKKNTKDEK